MEKQFGSLFRLVCASCGREIGAKIPRHGDNTAHRARQHIKPGTQIRCPDVTIYEHGDYLIKKSN